MFAQDFAVFRMVITGDFQSMWKETADIVLNKIAIAGITSGKRITDKFDSVDHVRSALP